MWGGEGLFEPPTSLHPARVPLGAGLLFRVPLPIGGRCPPDGGEPAVRLSPPGFDSWGDLPPTRRIGPPCRRFKSAHRYVAYRLGD
jgi:hypothetical protein